MKHFGYQMSRRRCLALLAGASAASLVPKLCRAENDRNILRLAISTDTLPGVNIDDARAAYLALINQYNQGQGGKVSAEVVPGVFITSAEIMRYVRQGIVESFGVTTVEYKKLIDFIDPETLVLQDYLADGIEYVLLAHRNSSYKQLADLQGAQILAHHHRDMVLMPAWLQTMLAANNLPQPERFFGEIQPRESIIQVVTPVFFRHAGAACLVRRSWEMAVELNPQLGRDLFILKASPRIIPIAIGFRHGCSVIGRKLLLDSMLNLANTTAGQQMAALYQCNKFVQRPASVMKGTLEMIGQSERLSAPHSDSRRGHS